LDKDRFCNIFKAEYFGPNAELEISEDKRNSPQRPITNTTFTCVVRGIPIETHTKDILKYLK